MKKLLYLTLFLSSSLLFQCKKNSEIDPSGQEQSNSEIHSDLLKKLTVPGAEKVDFDPAKNSFIVTFPDSYSNAEAEVRLSIAEGVSLSGASNTTKEPVLRYQFRGNAPLTFDLTQKNQTSSGLFHVYFTFPGQPGIELTSKELPIDARGVKFPIRFLARVGSIPASPDSDYPVLKIVNRKTGVSFETGLSVGDYYTNFGEGEKLITDDPIDLQIVFKNRKPVVFDNIKFVRGMPRVTVGPDYKVIYSLKDSIEVNGGFFISNAKYSVKFTSDYIPNEISASLKVLDASSLVVDQIPSLPEGSYLVSFFENETLIGKSAIQISQSAKECIESVWKGDINLAPERNVNQLSFNKGDEFFVKTAPVLYQNISAPDVDNSRLSRIILKGNGEIVELQPKLVTFIWGVADKKYPVGKYTIPADLTSGSYEVTAISPEGKETKPYWSKLQVR